ncbi:hypothetical protein [Pseudomonas huanghezhanensis]|uniref:hypothetical protein n=1 Tax=Pseudomonas huanghezhanensis TaxID=3002903 RepID=UPI002286441B|nr:hypothetical protein [Pseudomonas sp. BSw22131]
MNAGYELHMARGLSASCEARQMMADWLRFTHAPKARKPDYRAMLVQRYPEGLINDAELEALLGLLYE